ASRKLTLIRPSGMSRGRLSYTTPRDTIKARPQRPGFRVYAHIPYIETPCVRMEATQARPTFIPYHSA
ncbi:hypothetical protein, partial [Agrobacterium pusense]|uniref:hypothetical protein n=1 Tax=Agrobacterium pusense TaxID=648995 RepID=UPI001AEF1438